MCGGGWLISPSSIRVAIAKDNVRIENAAETEERKWNVANLET